MEENTSLLLLFQGLFVLFRACRPSHGVDGYGEVLTSVQHSVDCMGRFLERCSTSCSLEPGPGVVAATAPAVLSTRSDGADDQGQIEHHPPFESSPPWRGVLSSDQLPALSPNPEFDAPCPEPYAASNIIVTPTTAFFDFPGYAASQTSHPDTVGIRRRIRTWPRHRIWTWHCRSTQFHVTWLKLTRV